MHFLYDVFVLFLRSNEFTDEPFKSEFLVPYGPVVFLCLFPTDFQSQVLEGLLSLVQDLWVGLPDIELKSLAP